ncbi:MAG: DUF1499 domain-containing protein [Burkholderiales bacterium]|jgi:uncharacterized protein (DUF1499 family)
MPILSLRGKPQKSSLAQGRLGICPSTPNCVCSDCANARHAVEPLCLAVPPANAWPAVTRSVRELPRTQIVNSSSDYLHVECMSRFFGFVDDLELHLRPDDGIIAIRSASRLGYSDFGVNRRRVERLRMILRAQNILR